MKKSFKELKERSILSQAQMQSVLGGAMTGTCGFILIYSDGNIVKNCNVNKATVDMMLHDREMINNDIVESYWCCDSCASTSYCGN